MRAHINTNVTRLFLSLVLSSMLVVALFGSLEEPLSAMPPDKTQHEIMSGEHRLRLRDYQSGAFFCGQTRNLVPNPSFEQGIGESRYWTGAGSCSFFEDSPGYDGAIAAKISAPNTVNKSCMLITPIDQIPVEAGRFYDFSTWIEANLLKGNAYLAITFWQRRGTWKRVGPPAQTAPVANTQGNWVQVTGWIQAPAEAEYARVEATLAESSEGSVWFDDIFLGKSVCLSISKSDNPDPITPGQILSYTIAYSNIGRDKASRVEIIENYDDHVTFLRADPAPLSGTTNVWKITELLPSAQGTITVAVKVNDTAGQRASIFNSVQMLSEETPNPVMSTISTTINPNPYNCSVNVHIPEDSRSGTPGQSTDYNVAVRNSGSFSGHVSLTATSESSWGINLDPGEQQALSAGDSMSANVGLYVPQGTPPGITEVAIVTSTLMCVDGELATATNRVTTTVRVPIFLPATLKNYFDRSSWESEPNNSCLNRQVDGPLYPGREYYGYTNDVWDWFSVDVPGGRIAVDLAISTGTGVQLILCSEICNIVARDPVPEDGYHIGYTGIPGRYYVGIYTESNYSYDRPYILQITFP